MKASEMVLSALYFLTVLYIGNPVIFFIFIGTMIINLHITNELFEIAITLLLSYIYLLLWNKVRSYFPKLDNICIEVLKK